MAKDINQAIWYEYHPSTPSGSKTPSGSRTAGPDEGIFIPTRLIKYTVAPLRNELKSKKYGFRKPPFGAGDTNKLSETSKQN